MGTGITVLKTRPCVDCGKLHNMVIENTKTGQIEQYLDKCYDCIFKGCRYDLIQEQIQIEAIDPSEQPLADQLAAVYNHFVSNNSFTDRMEADGIDDRL